LDEPGLTNGISDCIKPGEAGLPEELVLGVEPGEEEPPGETAFFDSLISAIRLPSRT